MFTSEFEKKESLYNVISKIYKDLFKRSPELTEMSGN